MKKMNEWRVFFSKDHLFRGSFYLILNSIVLALGGFLFWILCSRLFSPEEVGIGSGLSSLLSLFIAFSILGFPITLLKYSPKLKDRNVLYSFFIVSVLFILLLSLLFVIFVDFLIQEYAFLNDSPLFILLFLGFAAFSILFTLSESIFIASRQAHYVLTKNLLATFLKVTLLFLLVRLGGFGIFTAVGLSLILSSIIIFPFLKIKFSPKIDWKLLKETFSFSFWNYLSNLILMLPLFGLPLFVTLALGTEQTAYFYIPWMISMAIFMIPQSIGKVFLSETSYFKKKKHLQKALLINYLLIIPAILVLLVIDTYLFIPFGENYVQFSLPILAPLLLSSIFFSIITLFSMDYNAKKKASSVVLINSLLAISTFLFASLLLDYGILGVSIAWALATILTSFSLLFFPK